MKEILSMNLRPSAILLACALGLAGLYARGHAGETAAGFSQPPVFKKTAAGGEVTFAVQAPADRPPVAEVSVVNAAGRVVRHLAAGQLGAHAPTPFQKDTLTQRLAWDGKD